MNRYYFVGENLDELAKVEQELKAQGISPLQMHVLPNNDAQADLRGLDSVDSLWRKDIVRSLLTGFAVGVLLTLLTVLVAYLAGISATEHWVMVGFLCVVLTGFCTWEGGLFGIQVPNREFRRFAKHLQDGKHVFFVDIDKEQRGDLEGMTRRHKDLKPIGTGEGEQAWLFALRSGWHRFMHSAP